MNKPAAQRYARRADLVTGNGHHRRSSGPARVGAEAWSRALAPFGQPCSSPALVMLKYGFGVSDVAIGAALGVTEMMANNYLKRPLFSPQEVAKIAKAPRAGASPEAAAVRRLRAERRAKFVVPDQRERLAVKALGDAIEAAREVLALRPRPRVDDKALRAVLKAKIAAGTLVLQWYERQTV